MAMFNKINGAVAIIRKNGGYKEVAAAERDGLLYVKNDAEWIRVYKNGTSKDRVFLDELITDPEAGVEVTYTPTGQAKVDIKKS